MATHTAPIIGYHRAPLSQKFGAPRQPNLVGLSSVIEMLPPYDMPAAFIGLEDFSHIWISWQFHHNYLNNQKNRNSNNSDDAKSDDTNSAEQPLPRDFRPQVRPPRLGGNKKIGVFASRSMYRPSELGLSVVRLERIEVIEGKVLLIINGADMIDGTPIIDIKPYVSYSDALATTESGFAPSAPLTVEVTMSKNAYDEFAVIVQSDGNASAQQNTNSYANRHHDVPDGTIEAQSSNDIDKHMTVSKVLDMMQCQILTTDMAHIKALIAQDPRPSYRRDEMNSIFVMRYKSVDVSFMQLASQQLEIIGIKKTV